MPKLGRRIEAGSEMANGEGKMAHEGRPKERIAPSALRHSTFGIQQSDRRLEGVIRLSLVVKARSEHGVFLALVAIVVCGCQATPARRPLDPIPMPDAVGIVNANIARIPGTLRAAGSVDGRLTAPDGRSGSYHLDAILFYLAPRNVRFVLKSFGTQKLLLGSNDEYYWYYDDEAKKFHCGRHGEDWDVPDILIPPEQIVDAMGLTFIPLTRSAESLRPQVQRIVDEYQQILFLERNEQGEIRLQKEYWLDRYAPRLIRRVVFRDPVGVVEMESTLDEYRPLAPGGPLLPHVMEARWPKRDSHMRFRVARWKAFPEIGPGAIQFAAPPECQPEERSPVPGVRSGAAR